MIVLVARQPALYGNIEVDQVIEQGIGPMSAEPTVGVTVTGTKGKQKGVDSRSGNILSNRVSSQLSQYCISSG